MAESPRSSLANILEYIWTLILACFFGKSARSRSELPLVTSSDVKERSPSREQFLRHPSLGSRHKETRSKRQSIFSLGSSMQYFLSFVHRSGSTVVPVVIITPSSPTRMPVSELLPPSLSSESPLELADPTSERHPTSSVLESKGDVPVPPEKEVSIPQNTENDISDVEFDSYTEPAAQEPSEPSFFLPESLQKITFEPIRCASHALSVVSDMLYDVPTWRAPDIGMPSYFTSTPPRARRSAEKTRLRDIENNYIEAIAPLEYPSHDDPFYQCVDLIPYPDVFDLDMYYDVAASSKKSRNRDCVSRNTVFLQNDDLIKPLPGDCKDKYDGMTPGPEPERDFKLCFNSISPSPSTQSLSKIASSPTPPSLSLFISQSQQQPHDSFSPRYIIPLAESTNTVVKTFSTTSPSSTLYSVDKSPATRIIIKSRREFHSLPVLAHNQRSPPNSCSLKIRTSSDSESELDADSMDALRARLREVCDSPPKLTFTEEVVEVWEPVSFF